MCVSGKSARASSAARHSAVAAAAPRRRLRGPGQVGAEHRLRRRHPHGAQADRRAPASAAPAAARRQGALQRRRPRPAPAGRGRRGAAPSGRRSRDRSPARAGRARSRARSRPGLAVPPARAARPTAPPDRAAPPRRRWRSSAPGARSRESAAAISAAAQAGSRSVWQPVQTSGRAGGRGEIRPRHAEAVVAPPVHPHVDLPRHVAARAGRPVRAGRVEGVRRVVVERLAAASESGRCRPANGTGCRPRCPRP